MTLPLVVICGGVSGGKEFLGNIISITGSTFTHIAMAEFLSCQHRPVTLVLILICGGLVEEGVPW